MRPSSAEEAPGEVWNSEVGMREVGGLLESQAAPCGVVVVNAIVAVLIREVQQ